MNEKENIKKLVMHILQHISVAVVTADTGSTHFNSLMYAQAATKALQYSIGCGEEQDVFDFVENYYCMIEGLSDSYPILPD
jgi:hypothetical protein